jgi:hypothetical protein
MKPMKVGKTISSLLLIGAATLLIAACTGQLQPAKQAIAGVESALDSVGVDAKKYIPEKYNEVVKQLNALKTSFNKNEFAAVVAGAPAVLAAAQALTAAAAAGKEEALKAGASEWTALAASMPPLLSSVEVRGEALEKAKKLPEGVDLVTARRVIADAHKMWGQAQEAAAQGRSDAAVDTAKRAKRRIELAAKALKMTLPPD